MADCSPHTALGAVEFESTPSVAMMICTAGHVDHGKTRLVKLLTGCETDRLKTEQERGLTIELGFAPCMIGAGTCVGIVDVPGHEKFIRTMVSGVSGIGMCILTVAADDGIKPQTVEHVRIMDFMGVPEGIVAITKSDLVDSAHLEQTIAGTRSFLKGTFLENAPLCPLSSETFEGYPDFYAILTEKLNVLKKVTRHGIFRMPVAQIFKREGFGSVIMGIPVEGGISTGERVEIVPGGRTGKIRGMQQFLHDSGEGEYGQCLALNIPEFGKTPPSRGEVLSLPGMHKASQSLHVRITTVPELTLPLKNAETVKVHSGTAEVNGKLYLLEDKELNANTSALASLVLAEPVAVAAHDRCIIRRLSPATTVAGGKILSCSSDNGKPRKRQLLETLHEYERFLDGCDPHSREGLGKRVEYTLLGSAKELNADTCAKKILIPVTMAESLLEKLAAEGAVIALSQGYFAHAATVEKYCNEAERFINDFADISQNLTLTTDELAREITCSDRILELVLDYLTDKGLVMLSGAKILLNDSTSSMSAKEKALIARITTIYEEALFSAPRPDELPEMLGHDEKKTVLLVEYLCARQTLIRLSKNVMLSRNAFLRAQEIAVNTAKKEGCIDSGTFKNDIGSTRKYAIAILDHLDALHVTIRNGNIRSLAPDYERRMLR